MGDRWYYWKHLGNRVLQMGLYLLAFLANGGTWPSLDPIDWPGWSTLLLALITAVWGIKVSMQGSQVLAQKRSP